MSQDKTCMDLGTIFTEFIGADRRERMEKNLPFSLEIEIIQRCAGSCRYCFASSTEQADIVLSTKRILKLLDEGQELGIKLVMWSGGDPLLHPDWFDLVSYANEKGMSSCILSSGLISKKDAGRVVALKLESVGMHIDSVNQEAYNKVHTEPRTLEKKMKGYKTLLEAGYPPNRVLPCITMSRPAVETLEETFDWFVDDMGANCVCFLPFKFQGFGKEWREWEPALSELKRAYEYRARRLGPDWLRIGASDATMPTCRTNITINPNGNVTPCAFMSDLPQGNIYKESLRDIFERSRDMFTFNFKVKGYCGECENNDVCFGCRANAYHYLGDLRASDPKCYLNPEAPEYIYPQSPA